MDVPQVYIPEILFNILVCGLATAIAWHTVACGRIVMEKVRGEKQQRQ